MPARIERERRRRWVEVRYSLPTLWKTRLVACTLAFLKREHATLPPLWGDCEQGGVRLRRITGVARNGIRAGEHPRCRAHGTYGVHSRCSISQLRAVHSLAVLGKASAAHAGASIYGIGRERPPAAGGRSGARVCRITGVGAGPALGKVTARAHASIYGVTESGREHTPTVACTEDAVFCVCRAGCGCAPGRCGQIRQVQRVGCTATARVCSACMGIGYVQQWSAPDEVWETWVWCGRGWVCLASLAGASAAYVAILGCGCPQQAADVARVRSGANSSVHWARNECAPVPSSACCLKRGHGFNENTKSVTHLIFEAIKCPRIPSSIHQ
ncbi:hypothetical protein B0H14DRAFT_2616835 [Mycena olivaceomarginata]|nr:hypothetical protein B0H14DRAFT_2616835 [Mycena olivaceomarginata]